ncbi:MAG: hypothetical protein QNK42_11505 [Pseudodonghicola sp.]|nr:hypothetical protein [Pseudodonghicola sp.]
MKLDHCAFELQKGTVGILLGGCRLKVVIWMRVLLGRWGGFVFSLLLSSSSESFAQAVSICHGGGGDDIDISIKVAGSNEPLQISVDERYFDKRFIPKSGSERKALGLRLKATDFFSLTQGDTCSPI